jgi:Thrombospondin type 3 repeat
MKTTPRCLPILLVAAVSLLAASLVPAAAGAKTKAKLTPSGPIAVKAGPGLPTPFGQMPARKPARFRAAGQQNWIEGVSKQQLGTNCSILGQPYSEPMVASYVRYGGLDHVPKVGEVYYGSIVTVIVGRPCPYGYSYVATEIFPPKDTEFLGGIQCIGISSAGNTSDLTNANWTDPSNGSTGRYCPAQAGTGQYGGIGLGFRPLSSGQTFEVRFKLRSNSELKGAAANPVDDLTAAVHSTGVYANPVTPDTWVNVVPNGQQAPVNVTYPNPAYTTNANPTGNLTLKGLTYSGGRPGRIFFRSYATPTGGTPAFDGLRDCAANCVSTVGSDSDLWLTQQTFDITQPTGGYFTLVFKETATGQETEGARQFFRSYFPDADGDGVDDATDQCDDKAAPGTANGCPAAPPPADADSDGVPDDKDACPNVKPPTSTVDGCFPDSDGDGKRDDVDKCPAQAGSGADGCAPVTQDPPPPPPPPVLDRDGDGKADNVDACPLVAAATADGCPAPAPKDADGDGVTDDRDLCPSAAAATPSGCPVLIPGGDTTKPTGKLAGVTGKPKVAVLVKGLKVTVTCSEAATVAGQLVVDAKTAKALKLKAPAGKPLTIATVKGSCLAGKPTALVVKPAASMGKALAKAKKAFAATLVLNLTDAARNAGVAQAKIAFAR